jgi:hypothetical protein
MYTPKYDQNNELVCVVYEDENVYLCIPADEGNADYQQYLKDTDGSLPLPKETKEDK